MYIQETGSQISNLQNAAHQQNVNVISSQSVGLKYRTSVAASETASNRSANLNGGVPGKHAYGNVGF
jgi:hypothetical protein